jgi:hypothetical protein
MNVIKLAKTFFLLRRHSGENKLEWLALVRYLGKPKLGQHMRASKVGLLNI